jgi:hypothetical protein
MSDRARHHYIAYSSTDSGNLGVRGVAAGRYQLLWSNPVTGAETTLYEDVPTAGDFAFRRPPTFQPEVALFAQRISP